MTDDAVAPVVAAMLVLAVIVTAFSAWNAILLPSLKQQSEMVQDREIQLSFSRFASDLTTAASLQRDLTLYQPLPLGGGGVIFSPITSSGTLQVNAEPVQLYSIWINEGGIPERVADGRMVEIAYRPVSDFWLDQGYTWQFGYVNVTRGTAQKGAGGAVVSTPLSFATMDEVIKSGSIQDFADSLVVIEAEPWYNSTGNLSHITVSSVTFYPEPGSSYVSSNGIGTFALAANATSVKYGDAELSGPDSLVIRVNRSDNKPFSLGLYETINQSFAKINDTYHYNAAHSFSGSLTQPTVPAFYNETVLAPVPGMLPFTVTHQHIAINVSVA